MIPTPLRALLWVDLSTDFDAGIRKVVKSIYDVSEKPPLGKIPEYITELKNSVGGLFRIASTVGSILLSREDEQLGLRTYYCHSGSISTHFPDIESALIVQLF